MPPRKRGPTKRLTVEETRLREAREGRAAWKRWGPYLSERQWGTVREDYSADGNAWDYFSHDQARSRAYHWGEDGIAGLSDDHQRLCFSVALWNGRDPILKERLFGLTNSEGNHGEDVKEYYFYLDSTPTHSYLKYLYKYPQDAFPYADLVDTNRQRGRHDPEYELLDTGVFDGDRYFDVTVEYAKAAPDDILVRISVSNRAAEPASLHVLPTLLFRNSWSWWPDREKPVLRRLEGPAVAVEASEAELGRFILHCEGEPALLFTENESNNERLFGTPNASPWVKDAFHVCVVDGRGDAVNPAGTGTKAAAHYRIDVGAGETAVIRLRLRAAAAGESQDEPFGRTFTQLFERRRSEADAFYRAVTPSHVGEDAALVLRQAMAGMLWSKQYYFYDTNLWLKERSEEGGAAPDRNREWFHLLGDHVISMPDKWEYPWFAAWDLAFHTVALGSVDIDFAKDQLDLLLRQTYVHPTGQIPAYEWNFGDVNPPVHAWAAIFLYRTEQALRGEGDREFLKRLFGRLAANFGWWINRKDRFGRSLFEGGFLGLDNIGVFDRSAALPTGGHLEQADGTAWMALFCQNMIEIASELAAHDSTYEELAANYAVEFLLIGRAINTLGPAGMWDEEDGFYYDVLRLPDGSATRLKVRSMVGLLPICATTVIEPSQRERLPRLISGILHWLDRMPDLRETIHATGPGHHGVGGRGLLGLADERRLRRILSRVLDEDEFLSPHGIRALSRHHADHPYVFSAGGQEFRVAYLPAESDSGMFGGNSNWRGPVWVPVNVLIIRALLHYYLYYGDNFRIECPTGSGREMNLFEVARDIANRLASIFLRDADGRRPVFGGSEKFQTDPHWRDNLLFYEYFHGDNGAGIGASHQTGWTGIVGSLIELFGKVDGDSFLAGGSDVTFGRQG